MNRRLQAKTRRFFIVLLCAVLCYHSAWHAHAVPNGVHYHHVNSSNKIALTFDDGPHPRYTPEILEILDEYGVHATFFFVGENVTYYPDVARRVAQGGHEIGNHTYHHVSPGKNIDIKTLQEELSHCEQIIQQMTDTSPKLFRPPQGNWNDALYGLAREKDYEIVLWNIDTLDWAHRSCEQITSHVLERVQSGDIILMHDYQSDGCSTVEALRTIIHTLIERGFHFVTVSELLGSI